MNFVFISPNFPHTYWLFCDRLRQNGVNVFGVGDCPYDALEEPLKRALVEYYKVNSLENYDEVKEAIRFLGEKHGKIDWIESNNEYWLEQDAKLREEFNVTTGILPKDLNTWKRKSLMHKTYVDAGIPTARQHIVTTIKEAKNFIDKVSGYPVIAKPDIGVGAAHTYKIENYEELENFFNEKIDVPYVMEEFIDGYVRSYDAIVDSKGNPIFESMTAWPPSIADIVNKDYDLSYYVSVEMDEKLRVLGRKSIEAFKVRSRFIHLEFFCLSKSYKGIGKAGDFAALEVNMRPAGGYTPDMMDFAHSTDVYQIWAEMVAFDKRKLPDSNNHQYCVYAGQKEKKYNYKHKYDEILYKYGSNMVMCESMPPLMWDTMGSQMYTAIFKTKEEVEAFIKFIQERS